MTYLTVAPSDTPELAKDWYPATAEAKVTVPVPVVAVDIFARFTSVTIIFPHLTKSILDSAYAGSGIPILNEARENVLPLVTDWDAVKAPVTSTREFDVSTSA